MVLQSKKPLLWSVASYIVNIRLSPKALANEFKAKNTPCIWPGHGEPRALSRLVMFHLFHYLYVYVFYCAWFFHILVLWVSKKCIVAPCWKMVCILTYFVRRIDLSYWFLTVAWSHRWCYMSYIDDVDFRFWRETCVATLARSVAHSVLFHAWTCLSAIIRSLGSIFQYSPYVRR